MQHQVLDTFADAYQTHFRFNDDNLLMLNWYARRIVRALRGRPDIRILSLGIGHRVVAKTIPKELGSSLARYTVIEGSSEIISAFRSETDILPNVEIIQSLFEDFSPVQKFDAIEMGFVLEHVDDPIAIVRQYSEFINPDGRVFIAVPNARSLHRLIGHEAGFLDNLHRLSAEDLELGHQRYFDQNSLCQLVLAAGLKIVKVEGILLKPFTSAQLKSLRLSPEVVQALLKVGVDFPDACNAVFVEAAR